MNLQDSFQEQLINDIYSRIKSLDKNHSAVDSPQWNELVSILEFQARQLAETKWPGKTVITINENNYKNLDQFKYTNLEFTPLDYRKTVLKILRYYKPEVADKNGEIKKIPFWKYFMFILYKDISRKHTEIKIQQVNSQRLFKISVRNQRKINKIIHLIKTEKKNPQTKIFTTNNAVNEEELIKLLLQKDRELLENNKKPVFKSENQIRQLLIENKEAYTTGEKSIDIERIKDDNSEDNSFIQNCSSISILELFITLLEQAFTAKIFVKVQNKEAQQKKVQFEKEIVTCYYISKTLKEFNNLAADQILECFKNRRFTSQEILAGFIKENDRLNSILLSTDKEKIKKYKKLENHPPYTLESISLNQKKLKNYGTRRITDFRKFFRARIENQLTVEPEEKTLLLKLI